MRKHSEKVDTQDGAYLRKWIDLDTALKISILDRLLVVAPIKGESKRPKKQRRNDAKEKGYTMQTIRL